VTDNDRDDNLVRVFLDSEDEQITSKIRELFNCLMRIVEITGLASPDPYTEMQDPCGKMPWR
jgi:hypothetical protein